MIWSRSKVHLCGRCGCGIVVRRANIARAEGPDAIDGERLPACILQQSVKLSGSEVVSGDEAAGFADTSTRKLPDQQIVAEASEIERSQSYTPRSVQPITVFQTTQEPACGTVDVNEAQAGAVGFEGRTSLVERIRNDNVVTYSLHVERHVVTRQVVIHERFSRVATLIGGVLVGALFGEFYRLKCVVINIHAALGEVSCIEETLVINEGAGQARIAGSVRGFDDGYSVGRGRRTPLRYCDGWVPPGNRPIDCREEKYRGLPWRQQEICLTAIGDSAGWCTCRRVLVVRIGWRDGDDQRLLGASSVVQGAEPCCLVRNPPR